MIKQSKRVRKIQICPICGRENNRENKGGYCRKHNHQLKKFGYIKDNISKTKFDNNEFIVDENISYIITRDVLGNNTQTFKIDTEDLDLVRRYKWRLGKDGYCTSGYSSLRLHRLILGVTIGGQVDHINNDITDNRKCNLRLCTNSLNQTNKKSYNSLGYKGISYYKSKKYGDRFHATITREDTTFHSPVFNTIEKACYARYLLELYLWEDTYINKQNIYTISEKDKTQVELKILTIKDKITYWLNHNIKQ